MEKRYKRKDGGITWAEISLFPAPMAGSGRSLLGSRSTSLNPSAPKVDGAGTDLQPTWLAAEGNVVVTVRLQRGSRGPPLDRDGRRPGPTSSATRRRRRART